jgi:hypothetical protein
MKTLVSEMRMRKGQFKTVIQRLHFTGTMPLFLREKKCTYVEDDLYPIQYPFRPFRLPRIECVNLHGLNLFNGSNCRSISEGI